MRFPRVLTALLATALALALGASGALFAVCGPFTDVTDAAFCPFILEIFYLGITTGTTPTTYDPASAVTRIQMAAFLSRTVDATLRRGSRRAAHDLFFTPQNSTMIALTTVDDAPQAVKCDGADVWVANHNSGTVSRVRESDGKLLETWTGATSGRPVFVAMGRVFVGGRLNPGLLYSIDPSQAAGAVTTLASNLGNSPNGITSDGIHIFTANGAAIGTGSVSLVTPGASIPWTVTNVTTGFSSVIGAIFDGTNVWVTDDLVNPNPGRLQKLDATGAILQTVTVGATPLIPAFDGANIWVPNAFDASVSVVRASTGLVLQTLTGNGLNFPTTAAFDGQRILVTNQAGGSVSLWKAADLTALQSVNVGGGGPFGAASDGLNFWISLVATNKLARF